MRKILCLVALSLTASLRAEGGAFSLWGEFVYLNRSHTYASALINTTNSFTKTTSCGCKETLSTLCDSQELAHQFGYEKGFRVGAKYVTQKTVWEASYMDVSGWEASCEKSSTGLLYFSNNPAFTLHDFTSADNARVHYKTKLEDGELNYFRYLIPSRDSYLTFCWLAGLRYSFLKENLGLFFTRIPDMSSYKVEAKNCIYGLQTGIGLQCNVTQRFFWDFVAKVGVGYDDISQKSVLGDYNDTVTVQNYTRNKWSLPLILNGRVKLVYLLEEWIDLHASYECIYFNGVALAPNQLEKNAPIERPVHAGGDVIFYGLFAGLTFNF